MEAQNQLAECSVWSAHKRNSGTCAGKPEETLKVIMDRLEALESAPNNSVQGTDIVTGVEVDTGNTLNGKTIYKMVVEKGKPQENRILPDIAPSGILIPNVSVFLGITWGMIRRGGTTGGANTQHHNINAISNESDQHSSVIYMQDGAIRYWFNPTMDLSDFKNRPFIAEVLYLNGV